MPMTENGHCTYLPGGEWILNDTYPDEHRNQHVHLYHVATGRRVPLGQCFSAPEYTPHSGSAEANRRSTLPVMRETALSQPL